MKNQKIDTSPREYQREKVAKVEGQDLILTVLTDDTAFVPEIHIRVIRFYNQGVPQWKIELLDGQQRTTTLIRFRRDEFPLLRVSMPSHLMVKRLMLLVRSSVKSHNHCKRSSTPICCSLPTM